MFFHGAKTLWRQMWNAYLCPEQIVTTGDHKRNKITKITREKNAIFYGYIGKQKSLGANLLAVWNVEQSCCFQARLALRRSRSNRKTQEIQKMKRWEGLLLIWESWICLMIMWDKNSRNLEDIVYIRMLQKMAAGLLFDAIALPLPRGVKNWCETYIMYLIMFQCVLRVAQGSFMIPGRQLLPY